MPRQILVRGVECPSAGEAIQHSEVAGGEPVRLGGRYFVVDRPQAETLERDGVPFAYLCERRNAEGVGQIMTVPVN